MRFRVAPILSSLGLLLLLLPASAPARADEGIADPCKLVTPEEVQLVLGTPVDRSSEVHVKDSVKFPVRICTFHGKNGRVLNVSTGVKPAADFATEWAGHDTIAQVGDSAYAVPPGVLVFNKGTSTCKLQALNFDFARDGHGRGYPDPALAAKLKTLAQAAAARM
jgi:hypothetical protein